MAGVFQNFLEGYFYGVIRAFRVFIDETPTRIAIDQYANEAVTSRANTPFKKPIFEPFRKDLLSQLS